MENKSKIESICIPLTLYSKHIPSKQVSIEKDYYLFGHYDALEIGNNLFEESGCDFTKLWEYSVEKADLSDLERNFSKQTIYAFRTNDRDVDWDNEKDKQFWTSKELPPFLFLCIIQTGNLPNLYDCRKALKKDVEKKYKGKDTSTKECIHVKCYSSLENNCIILAFRCLDFQKGLDIINTYHETKKSSIIVNGKEVKIQYTYTTIGFKTDYNYSGLNNQKIQLVHLYVIERSPGSAGVLYGKLKDKIGGLNSLGEEQKISLIRQKIIGNDDELWVLKNILWNDFLDLFLSEESLLAGGTENCEKYTYSIATHFINNNEETEEEVGEGFKENIAIDEKCEKIHRALEDLKCIYNKGSNKALHNKRKGYYKSIMYIINSLEKFEYAYTLTDHFNDYTYFMIYEPLLTMAEAILIATKMENIGISLRGRITPKQIYSFLNSVNMLTHHTTHADRQFMQTPDFNAIIFETPAKLAAFYGALVNLEKRLLTSESLMDYQFLIVPGMHEFVRVEDLFRGFLSQKRLSIIEIPEQQMFEPEFIIPMLMHEIAHKTGSNIRLREKRYQSFLEVIAYMLGMDLIRFCVQTDDFDLEKERECIEYLRNVIFPVLNDYAKQENEKRNFVRKEEMDKIRQSEEAEGIIEQIEPDYDLWHTENIRNNISAAVDRFIMELPVDESIMNKLWKTYASNCEQEEDRNYDCFTRKLLEYLNNYINNRKQIENTSIWKWYLFQSEFADILYIYREVYADVISIGILNIDINKYLNGIVKNNFMVLNRGMVESVHIIRIALVTQVMIETGCWKVEDLAVDDLTIGDVTGDYINELKNKILEVKLFVYGGRPMETQLDAPFAFKYKKVWGSIVGYMVKCIEKLDSTMQEEVSFVNKKREKKDIREDIRAVYKKIEEQKEEGVDKVLKEIEIKIEEFKQDVYKVKRVEEETD